MFRAGILPTRKVASLDRDERKRLAGAIEGILAEATKKGGSADACDIYGRPCVKAVARSKACTVCRTPIAKRSLPRRRHLLLPAVPEVGGTDP